MSQTVSFTLLLEGGHQETTRVADNHPLVQQMRQALADPNSPGWLELPVRDGQQTLAIPARRLVGVLSQPSLSLLPGYTPPPAVAHNVSAPVGVPATGLVNGIAPVFAAQVQEVLNPSQHSQLLEYVTQHEANFSSSRTSTGAINYRESRVCYDFEPFGELLKARVTELLPQVCARLKLPVPIGRIEAQLTAHNDQNFYKVHNDNSSPDTAHRVLTFVYYFHRLPKGFSNGQLRLYDRKVAGGYRYAADTYRDIEPLDNSIVFFEAGEMHEVLPVNCPSQQFLDSRFTINGWIGGLPTTP